MASASVKNIGMSPDNFMDCSPAKFPSYGWLSPRLSISREEEAPKGPAKKLSSKMAANAEAAEPPDLEISSTDFGGFEFCLEDPATMLPADELFADGKLVPLHLSAIRHSMTIAPALSGVRSPETPKSRRRNEVSPIDPYLFSPKAPRCSSRWKELLGLKKLYQKEEHKTTSSHLFPSHNNQTKNTSARGLKHFLHRNSKSSSIGSADSTLNLPLLRDSDNESSVSISARLSLSSSSSGHSHDELPRLSLDSDNKPGSVPRNTHQLATTATNSNLSRVRVVKHRTAPSSSENHSARARVGRSPMKRAPESSAGPSRGISVDSPRMNSSGKIVFQSLERSSSSPSSFNGGPRYKHRGMERSYSANVRITPVLNVPVCSLRGSSKSGVFGLFSSQQKKETSSGTGGSRSQHHTNSRNRTDRT